MSPFGTGVSRHCARLVFAVMLLGLNGMLEAAVITAKSPAFTDVSTAIEAGHDGDTIIVPAGFVHGHHNS